MEILAVLLVYSGAAAFAAGLAEPAWATLRHRPFDLQKLLRLAGTGALLVIVGEVLPSTETRVTDASSLHDRFAPVYQFNEVHQIEVEADPRLVYAAIKATTADEILLFRTLTWLRRLGRPGPESIMNAPGQRPLLEVATATAFIALAEEPGREIVIGTLVVAPRGPPRNRRPTPDEYAAMQQPGYAKATMNFLVEQTGPRRCRVRTETRVFATDHHVRRRFAAYWRVIYPGSALIRRMWLRAIRARALREALGRATLE